MKYYQSGKVYDSENAYFYNIEKIKEFISKYGYNLYSELLCANAVLRS